LGKKRCELGEILITKVEKPQTTKLCLQMRFFDARGSALIKGMKAHTDTDLIMVIIGIDSLKLIQRD
jgi:hypothetical protein